MRGHYNYRKDEDILKAIDVIEYCPDNGVITRVDRKNSNGSKDKDGYLIIKIKGVQWKAHRLAWTKYYGTPPKHNIDHIDGDRLNNKINNLRDVPQKINVYNTTRLPNKDTGVVGIYKDSVTDGLKAVYTIKRNNKLYRFRKLEDAIKFKNGN